MVIRNEVESEGNEETEIQMVSLEWLDGLDGSLAAFVLRWWWEMHKSSSVQLPKVHVSYASKVYRRNYTNILPCASIYCLFVLGTWLA